MRVVIAGGPCTGKTTRAKEYGWPVKSTDSLLDLDWSTVSAHTAGWFYQPGPWVIEGVAAGRALRKWLVANPTGKPCDVVVWLEEPYVGRSAKQEAMAKGCSTVWNGIVAELVNRGVVVEYPTGTPA